MNRAENLIKKNLNALVDFLGEHFGTYEFREVYENVLKDWDEVWRVIQRHLLEIPFTDRHTTLLYVVQYFLPDCHESFRLYIETLLSLHGEFWDQFYQNMVEAKNQIAAI